MAFRMMRKLIITWSTRPYAGPPKLLDTPELPNFAHEDTPVRGQEAWDTLARCSNLITLRREEHKDRDGAIRCLNLERR